VQQVRKRGEDLPKDRVPRNVVKPALDVLRQRHHELATKTDGNILNLVGIVAIDLWKEVVESSNDAMDVVEEPEEDKDQEAEDESEDNDSDDDDDDDDDSVRVFTVRNSENIIEVRCIHSSFFFPA